MNAALFKPAAETLGPLVLTRHDEFDGPWLGICYGASAEVANIVLVNDRRWQRIDASQPMRAGWLDDCGVAPLSAFGVSCTIYSHSRVLSAWRTGKPTTARQFGHPAGDVWEWAGARCECVKIERGMIALITVAAKNCNTEARGLA